METAPRRSKKQWAKDADELSREIRRSEQSRYDHRLHSVWLLARGMTYPAVAEIMGEPERTLAYWVHRYRAHGLVGLHEENRCGRPTRLTEEQRAEIAALLRRSPQMPCGRKWSGRALAVWIEGRYSIRLGQRQCGRILHELRCRPVE